MARTDKDRPWWVRAEDPLEPREEHHYHLGVRGHALTCDIDVSAKYKPGHWGNCHYWLPNSMYYSGPPAWFRRARWHGPERRRERNELGELAKRFRAGDLESLDFANFQHRHSASWDWH